MRSTVALFPGFIDSPDVTQLLNQQYCFSILKNTEHFTMCFSSQRPLLPGHKKASNKNAVNLCCLDIRTVAV